MADFNFFLNRQGPKGVQGVKGNTGFSPTIAPSADNDGLTTYKLVITNENNTYETDNLMGNLDIVDDGGTYLRYNREAGSVSASEADTATASAAGVVRLANSTDYANLADDAVMTPSSFVDNYNSLLSAGTGIEIFQNLYNDKIVIGIDDNTIVTETVLASTLANYVTNSSLSTTLNNYATQQWVNSRGFVDSINNQVIDGKKTFRDTIQIDTIIFPDGYNSIAAMSQGLSLVSNADSNGEATSNSTTLQLTVASISVINGLGQYYELIDTSTGFIPDARLSSNIARTSDIPTIATSASSSSTNAETVGAKLFYDTCGDIETLINSL